MLLIIIRKVIESWVDRLIRLLVIIWEKRTNISNLIMATSKNRIPLEREDNPTKQINSKSKKDH